MVRVRGLIQISKKKGNRYAHLAPQGFMRKSRVEP
jgi:hypothetical protein